MEFVNVYFSLGSNLGDRERNIMEALRLLDEALGCHYSALSRLIETEPAGFTGGMFLNAAVRYSIPCPTAEAGGCFDTACGKNTGTAADTEKTAGDAEKAADTGKTTEVAEKAADTTGKTVEAAGLRLLDQVKAIERSLGRTDVPEYDSGGRRIYRSRTIDIDILFYGSEHIHCERLTVPHEGIADRPFVMVPLRQIARPSLTEAFPDIFK